MGQVSQQWEEKTNLRADEVCKALVRMPLMTYVQIARLLSISPQQARNLVKHAWDRLCEQPYHSKHRSSKFAVGSHRLKVMVKLTEEAQKMWSEQERIISRSQVRPKDIDRVLSVMDILVELRWKGVLYDKWDMMLPQTPSEGLHAWLVRSDGYRMGMYLLPTRYDEIEFAKRAVILRGIIRRVTQHIGVSDTLFLVPTQQYENTLRIMTKLKNDGQSLFLLPLELFLTDPEWYLNAIADRERHGIQALWSLLDIQDTLTFTAQYQYAALCKLGPRFYRFMDVYCNGSVDRVRAWQSAENAFAYQIPGSGEVATAWVYVYDQTMAEALVKILGERDIITEFYPWPNAVHATSSKPLEPLPSKLDDGVYLTVPNTW